MGKVWGNEPAMVVGAVQAIIALVVSFGVDLSGEQIGAIVAVAAVALALVTRTQVTPVESVNQADV